MRCWGCGVDLRRGGAVMFRGAAHCESCLPPYVDPLYIPDTGSSMYYELPNRGEQHRRLLRRVAMWRAAWAGRR